MEYKVNQKYNDILKMPFYVAKKQIEYYYKYQEEFINAIKNGIQGLKK